MKSTYADFPNTSAFLTRNDLKKLDSSSLLRSNVALGCSIRMFKVGQKRMMLNGLHQILVF